MRNWKNEWLKKHAHYFTDIAMLFVFVGGIPLYIVIRNFVVNHYQFTLPGPNITNVIIFIIAVFTVSKIFSHLKYQKKKADQQKQLYAEFLARKKDLQIKQFYRLLHIIMEPQSDPAQIKKAQKVLIPYITGKKGHEFIEMTQNVSQVLNNPFLSAYLPK